MIDVIGKVSVVLLIVITGFGFSLYVDSMEKYTICNERGGVLVETYGFGSEYVCLDKSVIVGIK